MFSSQDTDRPTSNPLPPESEAFSDRNASVISSQRVLAEVSEQTPNFGTEQVDFCSFYFSIIGYFLFVADGSLYFKACTSIYIFSRRRLLGLIKQLCVAG